MFIKAQKEIKYLIVQNKLFLLLIVFSLKLTSCLIINSLKNESRILISFLNQVILTLVPSNYGNYRVLSLTTSIKPSKVYLDDKNAEFYNGLIEMSASKHKVKLIFSSPLKNCEKMFYECFSITEINFSEFDSSEVENINNMFENCRKLISIYFGNFNTSKITTMDYLFSGCNRLQYLNLSKFNTSNVVSFSYMFESCSYLISLDLSNLDTRSCTSVHRMFEYCKQLQRLKLTGFNTSNIKDMGYMFSNCYALSSLDLSSFNTKNVTNMKYMFYHCSSMTSLDLTTFDLQSIRSVDYMFNECTNLKIVKIKSTFLFPDQLNSYNDMTGNTHDNLILCVGDLINSNTNTKTGCSGCSIEKSNIIAYLLKINNFCCYSSCQECDNQGNIKNHLCKECKSDYNLEISINNNKNCYNNICTNLFYLDDDNKIICIEESICPIEYSKLIEDKKQCIQSCDLDSEYMYEYANKCYKEPLEESKTTLPIYEKKQTTIIVEPTSINPIEETKTTSLIYERTQTTNIVEFTPIIPIPESKTTSLTNEKKQTTIIVGPSPIIPIPESITTSLTNVKTQARDIIELTSIIPTQKSKNSINYIKEDIQDTRETEINISNSDENSSLEDDEIFYIIIFNNITIRFNISELISKNEICFEQNNLKSIMSTTDFQKKESSKSTIDLGNCEIKLRNESHIPLDEPLYILKMEFNISGMKIPKIEYEVYYLSNKREFIKLNLSICQNEKITISFPVIINDNIDKYNPRSGYYNDICYTTTSESGTDISLSDRKEEFINNNMTLCEENCTFIKYDYTNNKSVCSCEIKINIPVLMTEITFDKNKLYESFTDIKNIANILILKCYKLLFSKKGMIYNIGVYILIPIIIVFIVCTIIFISTGYKKLKNKIDLIYYSKKNWEKFEEIYKKSKNKIETSKENKFNNDNEIESNNNDNEIKLNSRKNKRKRRKNSNLFPGNNSDSKKSFLHKKKAEKTTKKTEQKILNKGHSLILLENNNDNNIINNNFNKNKRRINRTKTNRINNKINSTMEVNLQISELDNIQKYELIKKIKKLNDYELNDLDYQKAIKKDKRKYFQYYISLLKTNNLFIFSFIQNKDYNSKTLKIILFFFIFTLNFIVNALFFTDSTMHVIYEEKGKFNFLYQISKSIYSALISGVLTFIIEYLSLTEKTIISLKKEKNLSLLNQKRQKVLRDIKIKTIFFFSISFCLFLFFCYYIGCFCAVYKNTQIHLIKDFLLSFFTSLIYPFFIDLLPGIFRIIAIKSKKRETLYRFSKFLQSF